MGQDSSVGIAACYGLGGLEIETRWGLDIPYSSRPALGASQPPLRWVPGFFLGSKAGGALTTHPYLAPRLGELYL